MHKVDWFRSVQFHDVASAPNDDGEQAAAGTAAV